MNDAVFIERCENLVGVEDPPALTAWDEGPYNKEWPYINLDDEIEACLWREHLREFVAGDNAHADENDALIAAVEAVLEHQQKKETPDEAR